MTQASIIMAVSNNPATIHNLLLAMPGTLKMDTLAGTTTVGFSDGLVSTGACWLVSVLAADTAFGLSAAAGCAVVVDSPPAGDDSVAACCDCDGVSAGVSLETEPA